MGISLLTLGFGCVWKELVDWAVEVTVWNCLELVELTEVDDVFWGGLGLSLESSNSNSSMSSSNPSFSPSIDIFGLPFGLLSFRLGFSQKLESGEG